MVARGGARSPGGWLHLATEAFHGPQPPDAVDSYPHGRRLRDGLDRAVEIHEQQHDLHLLVGADDRRPQRPELLGMSRRLVPAILAALWPQDDVVGSALSVVDHEHSA